MLTRRVFVKRGFTAKLVCRCGNLRTAPSTCASPNHQRLAAENTLHRTFCLRLTLLNTTSGWCCLRHTDHRSPVETRCALVYPPHQISCMVVCRQLQGMMQARTSRFCTTALTACDRRRATPLRVLIVFGEGGDRRRCVQYLNTNHMVGFRPVHLGSAWVGLFVCCLIFFGGDFGFHWRTILRCIIVVTKRRIC